MFIYLSKKEIVSSQYTQSWPQMKSKKNATVYFPITHILLSLVYIRISLSNVFFFIIIKFHSYVCPTWIILLWYLLIILYNTYVKLS